MGVHGQRRGIQTMGGILLSGQGIPREENCTGTERTMQGQEKIEKTLVNFSRQSICVGGKELVKYTKPG